MRGVQEVTMDRVAALLALHGALVLVVVLLAGLCLYRAMVRNGGHHGWHLLHSGGSGRALLLLALAGVLRWVDLPVGQLAPMAWLMIVFVWTFIVAMIIVAVTGQHGFGWNGPVSNKVAFGLRRMTNRRALAATHLALADQQAEYAVGQVVLTIGSMRAVSARLPLAR
jgi:hypothetical protein